MAEHCGSPAEEVECIVISDSDSESESKDISKKPDECNKLLFEEFLTCCHDLMLKVKPADSPEVQKIEKNLQKRHQEAKQEYVSSEEFNNILTRHLSELKDPNLKRKAVFSHVHDVIIHLKNAAAKSVSGKWDNCSTAEFSNRDGGKSEEAHDRNATIDVDTPSCSTQGNFTDGNPTVENSSEAQSERSHKIRRLERLMGRLDKEIKRYSERELSLDDMKKNCSAHMVEHKLRKRFVIVWEKWCKLKGNAARTGRATEKKIRFQGTRYPEINRRIQKLIKGNNFPDFSEVYSVVERVNANKGLGIHRLDLHHVAREAFRDAGELLRRQRGEDLMFNFGYASLDVEDDPANNDPDLKRRLESNASLGKQMMDNVFEKYSKKQYELQEMGFDLEASDTSDADDKDNIDDDDDNKVENDSPLHVKRQRVDDSVEENDHADTIKVELHPNSSVVSNTLNLKTEVQPDPASKYMEDKSNPTLREQGATTSITNDHNHIRNGCEGRKMPASSQPRRVVPTLVHSNQNAAVSYTNGDSKHVKLIKLEQKPSPVQLSVGSLATDVATTSSKAHSQSNGVKSTTTNTLPKASKAISSNSQGTNKLSRLKNGRDSPVTYTIDENDVIIID